jgi:dTDP-4-dehydrorhamnose 3,5-epimerase
MGGGAQSGLWVRVLADVLGESIEVAPHAEEKLVRCTAGTIYDVIVDLRPDSATFRHWFGVELTSVNRRMLYIPAGLAHGFLTLTEDAEVFYQISEFYAPDCARGVRWNDPAFGIRWPNEVAMISERDCTYPDFAL